MLLKLIKCEVRYGQQASFSNAQEVWKELASAPGFIGQFGGWNDIGQAVIVGLWESHTAYEYFMDFLHDQMIEKSDQSVTYEDITIELLKITSSGSEVNSFMAALRSYDYLSYSKNDRKTDTGVNVRAENEKNDLILTLNEKNEAHSLQLVTNWTVIPTFKV